MISIEGYTIESLLHQGKKYSIYRAVRNSDKQKVIIKACRYEQYSAKDSTVLQQEYRLLAGLNSANVITAYELLNHDHQPAIILQDIGGIDLHEYLSSTPLSLKHFFTIALQITDALSDLHVQNIIHKDINPSNIIVHPETLETKIIDLGISVQMEQERQVNTPLKELEGTLAYISPEQTGRMNRDLDYRTDFYSLGITFYEILTGQLPFASADPLELIHGHLAKHPPLASHINPDIPKPLALLINKLIAKVPEERYASTVGLKADLIECQNQWLKMNTINAFELGQKDIHDRLTISQKLYGREAQLTELLSAYTRVCQGSKELILVSGYSGIGKTSLVKELYKPITQHKGYFISGKYDQLRRATPYSAFVEAFEDLMRRFLTEPKERLEGFKHDLLAALGNNGQVITAVIPNVTYIIGEQPAVPDLPPVESQNRFMLTFQNFVRAIAQPEHPLTLFIDDLQWVDNASLHLLTLLLTDPELKHLLVIGSYRNNEVTADHPFTLTLQDLQKQQVKCSSISLLPLQLTDIQQFLADSLALPTHDTLSLANLLATKTGGNPFFINEFLKKIYHDKLLYFDYKACAWQWDLDSIMQHNMTDNVIDLLTARICQFSNETQYLLKLAACIGHIFDLSTLTKISGFTKSDITIYLIPVIQSNLIALHNNYRTPSETANKDDKQETIIIYRFTHDKIQQSAYQLIEQAQREATHLSIGRLLLADKQLSEQDEKLFDIINHYNHAHILITAADERRNIAEANLWACQKAKRATAYDSAKMYCNAGINLLSTQAWQDDYPLIFTLHKELMECEYLTANHEQTSVIFQQLITRTNNLDDKVAIYRIQISMLNAVNKSAEALRIGFECLKLLGITFPQKPNDLHIVRAILGIKRLLIISKWKRRKIIPAEDKTILTASHILLELSSSAYMTDVKFFLLIICYQVYTGLRYGSTHGNISAFLSYSYILIHIMKNIKDGFYFESINKEIKGRYPELYNSANHVDLFVQGYMIEYLVTPLADCINKMMQGYINSLERGDLIYANFNLFGYTVYSLYTGQPLDTCWQKLQNYKTFRERTKVTDFDGYFHTMLNSHEYICSNTIPVLPTIDEIINITNHYTTPVEKCGIYFQYIKLYSTFGYHAEVFELFKHYQQYQENNAAALDNKLALFYYTLSVGVLATSDLQNQNNHYRKEFKRFYKAFCFWSLQFPSNLSSYEFLLDGISYQISNNIALAMQAFNKSIQEAKKRQHLELLALSYECAARFYLNIGQPIIAKAFMTQAYNSYIQWNARAKANMLEQEFSDWLRDTSEIITKLNKSYTVTATATTSFGSLDSLSIFKSAQVLSSEIKLESLLKKMLSLMLENAGAQRAVLLIRNNDQWYIEAEGSLDNQTIYPRLSKPLTEDNLPVSIINYAERTKELVLIQNATEREIWYQQDNYLQQVQSIFTLPILHQNQLKYLLYFENRDVSHAFTPENLNTLQLLASQAAISLENAKLYHQATHDALTGLANRSLLQYAFNEGLNHKIPFMAILFLDLDGFKQINDTLGHEVGDKLLIYFAEQLKQNIQEQDLAVRLGGDEFIILLKNTADINQVKKIASQILHRLKKPALIAEHSIVINSSIGISLYPEQGNNIDILLKQADTALYRAKTAGKGQYQLYSLDKDT